MLVAIIVWQIRRIVGSDHPISRAVEALALSVPLYVLLFATTYFLMARANPPHGEIELRDVVVNGGMDDGVRRVEIPTGESIAACRRSPPMEGPFRLQQLWIQSLHRLTDLDQPKTNSIEDQSVAEIASLLVSANGLDGVDDVGQPLLVVTAHSGIASCSASARTAGRRPSAGTTSTGAPRTSLSSRSNCPNVTRLDRGERSTRMSTSLSSVSWPRATLPNTLTLDVPYLSAVASTCRRRCLRRRPRGESGKPGRASGAGSSRISSRCPVAAISRSSVPNAGSRRPDSYELTTLWATCARRATSVCDRLARVALVEQ